MFSKLTNTSNSNFCIPHIEVFGGLTSRLYALSLIRYLCPYAKFYWNKSTGIQASFNDLFKNTEIISGNEGLSNLNLDTNFYFYGTPVMEERFNSTVVNRFSKSNINITNASHNEENLHKALSDPNGYLYIDYPVKHQNLDIKLCESIFCTFIDSLVLTDELYNIFFKYANLLIGKKSVGINIRNCQKETINYHLTSEINFKDTAVLLEPEKDFEKLLLTCCFIDQNVENIIRVADDKLVMINESDYPLDCGESKNGVGRALVEWLLLASVTKSCISKSGYAIKASIYGNNREYIK